MSKKHTFEYIEQYFKEHGCQLLEDNYINNCTKMRYRCSCGDIRKVKFSHFTQKQTCKKCEQQRKIKFVKRYFREQGCELLEKEYKSVDTHMKYKCNCGEVNKITFEKFRSGRRCKKCGNKKSGKKRKNLFKDVKRYFKEQGCELLEQSYVGAKTKMRYKCNCGDIGKICFNHFKRGKRCKKCGIEKNSGENHWNYNYDLTDKEREIKRYYPEYKKWRTAVYKKNNYICQKCLTKGGRLNAHHIYNYSSHKSLRLLITNGITFCLKCHKSFHIIYGIKNNNEEQLEEFLTA